MFKFLARILRDQRGQIGENEVEDEVQDEDPEEPDEESEEDPEESDDDQDESEEPDEEPETNKKVAELEDALKSAQKEINRLGYALRKQEKPKKQDEDPVFSDAQFTKIIEEHADDPAVLVQVINQMVKQKTSGVKDEAVNAAEIKRTKQELDNYLYTQWPELKEEGSELRTQMEDAKNWMALEQHPYGDFLAMAAAMMQQIPTMIEKAKEEAKAEALKAKTESNRKKKIKATSPARKGKKDELTEPLPASLQETAKDIGLNDRQMKLYAKIIAGAKKGKPISAEV